MPFARIARFARRLYITILYLLIGVPRVIRRRQEMARLIHEARVCEECDWYGFEGEKYTLCDGHMDQFDGVLGLSPFVPWYDPEKAD